MGFDSGKVPFLANEILFFCCQKQNPTVCNLNILFGVFIVSEGIIHILRNFFLNCIFEMQSKSTENTNFVCIEPILIKMCMKSG